MSTQTARAAFTPITSGPTLETLHELVKDDMRSVDTVIRDRLRSDVDLVSQVAEYIIGSGGKRLRPLIVLLCARACETKGQEHISLAAIVEFIHTATLLHDDVVDASMLRRGHETANAVYGNEASVLVGDFLYSRAFQMMVSVRSMRVMEIMADTTNLIAEGEVLQLLNCHDPDTTAERYLEVITRKTAKLFEAAARLGAVAGSAPSTLESAIASFGLHLGIAYQLVDDVLDYHGDADAIGKNVGDDLAEGKPTLPLIQAMRVGDEAQTRSIREAIENGGRENIGEVLAAVESSGAIQYTARLAADEARMAVEALDAIPNSPYREALVELSKFAVSRSF